MIMWVNVSDHFSYSSQHRCPGKRTALIVWVLLFSVMAHSDGLEEAP